MDDALVLLQHVSRHPEGKQTYMSLSKETGIPYATLHRLIDLARRDEHGSVLVRAAYKWRFDFELHRPGSHRIISAVFMGYG